MENTLSTDINQALGNAEHLNMEQSSGKFRISNKQAQADYTLIKTKKNHNGKIVYKKSATTNDEKIADTCVEIFQNSSIEIGRASCRERV